MHAFRIEKEGVEPNQHICKNPNNQIQSILGIKLVFQNDLIG